jgi:hypothetical protein
MFRFGVSFTRFAAVIALVLPLVLAACKGGGGSGY